MTVKLIGRYPCLVIGANLGPIFQPMKTRANSTLYTRFFPRYEQAIVDSDWFIVLFAPIVITLLLGFQRSFKNDYNNLCINMGSIFIPLTQSANLLSPYKHLAQVACNLHKPSTVKVIENTQTFTWDYVNSARNSILLPLTHEINRHPNRVYSLM